MRMLHVGVQGIYLHGWSLPCTRAHLSPRPSRNPTCTSHRHAIHGIKSQITCLRPSRTNLLIVVPSSRTHESGVLLCEVAAPYPAPDTGRIVVRITLLPSAARHRQWLGGCSTHQVGPAGDHTTVVGRGWNLTTRSLLERRVWSHLAATGSNCRGLVLVGLELSDVDDS